MDEAVPQVKMSDSDDSKPKVKIPDPIEDIRKKYDFQTYVILGIFVVAFLTMLLMVGGLLLDSWHFNSTVYKEYSSKIDTIENLQKTNKELLEQSVQNQKIIVELQQNVQSLVNKWIIKK